MEKLETCGTCKYGLPCEQVYRNQRGIEAMKGWLACAIRQNTPLGRATYMSPNRKACNYYIARSDGESASHPSSATG